MKEVLFEIGPFTIYGYGFMVALGVLAAFLVGMYREKKYEIGDDQIFSLGLWCLVCGWGAAKVLFIITELPTLFENPKYFLETLASGFVVYGGLIGGVLTGYVFCRVKKLPFLQYFDLVMPSVALAQAVGRFGCLMAGCCYGKATESVFHIIFPVSCNYAPGGVPLIPTQLISAAANFLNFFVLLFFAKRTKSNGQVGGLYLIFYSIGRFIIECFRDDPRGNVGPLSTSQFIAIFMLIAGIAIYVYCGKKYPKKAGKTEEAQSTEAGTEEAQEPEKEEQEEENTEEGTETGEKSAPGKKQNPKKRRNRKKKRKEMPGDRAFRRKEQKASGLQGGESSEKRRTSDEKTCAVILAAAVAFASMAGCGKKSEETEAAGTQVLEETMRLKETAGAAETTQEAETKEEETVQPAPAENAEENAVVIRLGGLKGPTSMGMVKLLDDAENGRSKSTVEFTMAVSGDELAPKLLKGDLDVAAVPANLASVLYHNSDGAVQFVAVNTLGVLSIVETGGEDVQSVADLKGQTIYATGKGTTPEYALRYLLSENGVDPDRDVTIEWMNEPTETVAKMAQAEHAVAMLPQPFVTVAGGQLSNFRIALDLTEEWERLENGSRLITAGLVVRKEFAEAHPEALKTFLEEYKASADYLNENLAEGAALVEKYDIVKAAVAEKAIPGCNVTYLDGEGMKTAMEGYLQVLYDANPKAVGGSLPDDGFYLVLP